MRAYTGTAPVLLCEQCASFTPIGWIVYDSISEFDGGILNSASMWAERNVHYTKQLAAVGRFELPSLVSRRFTMYTKYELYIRSFL